MKATRTLILMLIAQTIAVSQAESPNIIGTWNIEITFANEEHRSLRFDAQNGDGKGTLLLVDPSRRFGDRPRLRKQSGPEAKEIR